MVITGRIYEIVIVSENVAKIVLKKKVGDKIHPVAIDIMGYWKDKALKELKLKPKDKIRGNFHMKSKLYNGKYYTDVFFKEIMVLEEAPKKMKKKDTNTPVDESNLFQSSNVKQVDMDTGEIIN